MARIRSANSRLEEIQKEKRALEEQRKDIHANRNLWDSFKLGLAKGFNSLSVAVKGYSDTWSEGVIHDYFAREFDQIQALNQEEKKLTQEITASQQDIIKVDTQSEAKTKVRFIRQIEKVELFFERGKHGFDRLLLRGPVFGVGQLRLQYLLPGEFDGLYFHIPRL